MLASLGRTPLLMLIGRTASSATAFGGVRVLQRGSTAIYEFLDVVSNGNWPLGIAIVSVVFSMPSFCASTHHRN